MVYILKSNELSRISYIILCNDIYVWNILKYLTAIEHRYLVILDYDIPGLFTNYFEDTV